MKLTKLQKINSLMAVLILIAAALLTFASVVPDSLKVPANQGSVQVQSHQSVQPLSTK